MKRFVTTVVLTVALSSFALAGQIPSLGSPAPAPNGSGQTATTTSPGNIPSDGLSDAALSALLAVFGLLGYVGKTVANSQERIYVSAARAHTQVRPYGTRRGRSRFEPTGRIPVTASLLSRQAYN